VTGIAGPGGGSPEKPVGTVFLALTDGTEVRVEGKRLAGDRSMIKSITAELALVWLLRYCHDHAFVRGA
jgi:nicotinamide-nucleotide amidase